METLTRLVSESLARHGFDRPLDYRRLQWSRWFRCESHHSLLFVPSKPGVFALAEEVMSLGNSHEERTEHVETAALGCRAGQSPADVETRRAFAQAEETPRSTVEERRFSAASKAGEKGALAPGSPEADHSRRMLAVSQFFEADDMAYVLDRMLSRNHSTHSRLESGRYFIRYVEIQDETQRRNICNALNQWIASSSEKATGIGSHFATSLELTPTSEQNHVETAAPESLPRAQSRGPAPTAATEVYRAPLFPSGF